MATYFIDKVQRHVNKGYNKAAFHLGTPFVQYRPQTSGPVLVNANMVQELYLGFDKSSNFDFLQPQDYNNAKYYALVDLTLVEIGDYFYDFDKRTFFVANIEPIKPAELMLCNHTISLYHPTGNPSTYGGYGGITAPTLKFSGWPVVLLPGTKGESNEARTPGSIRAPWGVMQVPRVPGITIDEYDLVIDEGQRRFIVSQASLAKEGWWCSMALEQA